MSQQKGEKKVVKVNAPAAKTSADAKKERVWTPTPEAKSQATKLRIFAWVAWIAAIGVEVLWIFWALPQANERFWLLLVLLIPIAILAFGGNMLWKKANRLDPASKANKTKFFIQNQLGVFMTVLAFLPLIILALLDKNMDGKQKGIVGGVAAVLMVAIGIYAAEFDGGPSQEQYAYEENIIERLTGVDEVFWVKGGTVFHVCDAVPDVNKESADGTIYRGTVAEAHAFGKDRLTKRWESEATNWCGYTQEDVDAVNAGLAVDFPDGEDTVPDGDTGEGAGSDDAGDSDDAGGDDADGTDPADDAEDSGD